MKSVTFGAAALHLRRVRTIDMFQLVKEWASTGASGILATVPLDVGPAAACFLVAFAVLTHPWRAGALKKGNLGRATCGARSVGDTIDLRLAPPSETRTSDHQQTFDAKSRWGGSQF